MKLARMLALVLLTGPALADVTTQERLSIDLGGAFDFSLSSTDYTAADRQRRDSQVHCQGFMSLLCPKGTESDITRLDRGVRWDLVPDKKSYRETPLPTPEQRALARQRLKETLASLQQCQASQPQPAQPSVDRSKCELSAPVVTVKEDGPHATLIGHDTQQKEVTIAQTCTNRESGDVCELHYVFDVWLTPEHVEGVDERNQYTRAYLKRMGLDDSDALLQGQVRRFMAAYADQLQTLSSKAQAFSGTALKSAFHVSIGGEHCGQAHRSQAPATAPPSEGSTPVPTSIGSAVSTVGGKLLGGLFKKKQESAAPRDTAADSTVSGTPMVTVATLTSETTAIDPGAIAADRFEIPPGWTLLPPPPQKVEKTPTCAAATPSD